MDLREVNPLGSLLRSACRMNSICALVLAVPLLFVGCESPQPTAPGPSQAEARAQLEAEYDINQERDSMIRVLNLDPAQAQALTAAYDQRDEEVGAWIAGEKGQRLIALEAEMGEAARSSDLEGVKRATSEARPLRDELIQLIGDHTAAIRTVLGPANCDAWDGYEIASEMLELMTPLALDANQRMAIEGAGAQAFIQARDRGESNPSTAAFLDLEQWAESSVLSPAQYEAYQEIKSANKLRSL